MGAVRLTGWSAPLPLYEACSLVRTTLPRPFALSLSKGRPSSDPSASEEEQGFDKLSPNGL